MSPEQGSAELAASLMQQLRGNWITQMLHVAARLELAEQLAEGERSVGELAVVCGADPESLHRLLRALASIGVFRETAPGRFSSTPKGDLLRRDHPHSLQGMALLQGSERYQAWGDLLECIRSGEGAFARRFGEAPFRWNRSHPEAGRIFDQAMAESSRQELEALLQVADFTAAVHLVDVGGGRGHALRRILETYPQLQGTLFDLPEVVAAATASAETASAALAGRWQSVGGDAMQMVPPGADVYLLKNVLHDWDDAACLRILRSIRDAMAPEAARLLVYEGLMQPGNEPCAGKLLDLNMLVVHGGGRERSLEQYAQLLAAAGLRLDGVHPTGCAMTLLEVRRP